MIENCYGMLHTTSKRIQGSGRGRFALSSDGSRHPGQCTHFALNSLRLNIGNHFVKQYLVKTIYRAGDQLLIGTIRIMAGLTLLVATLFS